MDNAISIFVSGITGVFFGMGFLYLSIKVTAWIIDRFQAKGEEGK